MIKQIHCWRSNFSISQWTVLLIGLSLHIWMNEAAWWRGSPPSRNLDMAKPMTTESVIRVTGHTGGGTIEASPSRITSIASPVKHWIQRRRTRDGRHAAISTHTGSWCLVLLGVASELTNYRWTRWTFKPVHSRVHMWQSIWPHALESWTSNCCPCSIIGIVWVLDRVEVSSQSTLQGSLVLRTQSSEQRLTEPIELGKWWSQLLHLV